MRRSDLLGRIIGLVVFLGGIGLLAFIFSAAYGWFTEPSAGLQTAPVTGSSVPATTQLGTSLIRLLVRIGLLLVMTIIGSLLASRGAQLYFAAINTRPPAIAPTDE